MPTIKINYQPEVFDDPEYCENKDGSYTCPYLNYSGLCGLFRCRIVDGYRVKKNDDCRRFWNKANESRPPKTLPEGHRLG